MAAIPAPNYEPNARPRRTAEGHRRTVLRFQRLPARPAPSCCRRLRRRVVFGRLGRRPGRVWRDHPADLPEALDARRQEVAVVLDDAVELAQEEFGLLVG